MTTRYSKTTGSFYPYDIDYGTNLPADVIDVSLTDFAVAMARPSGYTFDFVNGALVLSPPAPATLDQVQSAQIQTLEQAYAVAIAAPVSFTTAAGVTKTFQVDPVSVQNMSSMLSAFTPAGAAPSGFYWVSADNTRVPFVLVDMQGLAKAMGDQGWAQFQHLQTQKAAVLAATTVTAVQAITW